jgi:hypothetical protein
MLQRFDEEGRGRGIYDEYRPWHQITRSDPASLGRSHILNWYRTERDHHLLSDVERDYFLFASMLADDIREQLPLSLEGGPSEEEAYNADASPDRFPGTLEICDGASIRHPRVTAKGESMRWVLTTDLVVRLRTPPHTLIPISVKYDSRFKRPRTMALLLVESSYWARRKTPALLLSTEQFDRRVVNTLRVYQPWGLNQEFRPIFTESDFRLWRERVEGRSTEGALKITARSFQFSLHQAQCAFWQAVWAGHLPVDLSKLGWPDSPIVFLSPTAFWRQNPIAARRSATW